MQIDLGVLLTEHRLLEHRQLQRHVPCMPADLVSAPIGRYAVSRTPELTLTQNTAIWDTDHVA